MHALWRHPCGPHYPVEWTCPSGGVMISKAAARFLKETSRATALQEASRIGGGRRTAHQRRGQESLAACGKETAILPPAWLCQAQRRSAHLPESTKSASLAVRATGIWRMSDR